MNIHLWGVEEEGAVYLLGADNRGRDLLSQDPVGRTRVVIDRFDRGFYFILYRFNLSEECQDITAAGSTM